MGRNAKTHKAPRKWGAHFRGKGWLPLAPTSLPSFEDMFEDIGAAPWELARHLGTSMSSVYRWLSGEVAVPRAHLLAMFYETQWGRSFVSCAAEENARVFGRSMLALREEVEALRSKVERLGRIGDFGSANDPMPEVELERMAQVWELQRELDTVWPRRALYKRSA